MFLETTIFFVMLSLYNRHSLIYRHAYCDHQTHCHVLTLPRMALALSAEAFSVSAPSVWNSLSYDWL